MSCDLLRIYYFCTINHSECSEHQEKQRVVICFEFIIFALSITAKYGCIPWTYCCDLLRIYYFCTINHSCSLTVPCGHCVVICFEFIIFALSITAFDRLIYTVNMLWFASNLLFLHYQSQHRIIRRSRFIKLWFASNLLFLHYQSQPSDFDKFR